MFGENLSSLASDAEGQLQRREKERWRGNTAVKSLSETEISESKAGYTETPRWQSEV